MKNFPFKKEEERGERNTETFLSHTLQQQGIGNRSFSYLNFSHFPDRSVRIS